MKHKMVYEIKKELCWNYISLIIMAISGLAMNAMIALFYTSSALGIFNEVYAWYLILSQIAVWGIHMAVVKFVPERSSDDDKGSILRTSLLLVFISSLIVASAAEIIIWHLFDLEWRFSLALACTGLVLFSVNKVLLNYLNAIHEMTIYAVFTALRYGMLMAVVLILSFYHISSDWLTIVFPITEVIIFAGLCLYIVFKCKVGGCIDKKYIRELICFGAKILPSYMVLEMNTKVDVICLGFILADTSEIGIYSFAILFTEGFYMLYVTIRKLVNPGLSEANSKGRIVEYVESIKDRMKKYLLIGSTAAYVLLLGGYELICIIIRKQEYQIGIIYIAIICAGIA